MDALLKYYEVELALLNALCQDFSVRYPQLAGRLGIQGNNCKDPHVERLIQACALLSARTAKRLDDSYAEFTESLLELNFPHYLRPFPACAIACVDASARPGAAATIPRGTIMSAIEHDGVICKFTTAYDVVLGQLKAGKVRFRTVIDAPQSIRLPPATGPAISITIESTAASAGLERSGIKAWRLYINADQSLSAVLGDVLFTRVIRAYVEADALPGWALLDKVPVTPVGHAKEDALIPFKATSHPAYRLLTEYFCFPEKFNFIDINLEQIAPRLPTGCRRFTLHLLLSDAVGADFFPILRPLCARHLLPGCTPVVNLFRQAARPIHLTHTSAAYPLVAESRQAHAYDIYSVDAVTMLRESGGAASAISFHPMYSTRHGDAGGRRGHYWVTRRDEALAISNPGYDMTIAFVDIDMRPDQAATETVSITLTCSNRDLPARLDIGAVGGDLQHEAAASDLPVRLLGKPSAPHRFSTGKAAQWRLLSQLSLNHQTLTQEGLGVLKEILELYNLPASDVAQRQIGGLAGMRHRTSSVWLQSSNGGSLIYGIDVLLTIDESAYVGGGLHAFVQVIDYFLALYVQLNSYTRLIVLSQQTGKELLRCPPRNGLRALA
jgi:type VI secretion system protein ImpG